MMNRGQMEMNGYNLSNINQTLLVESNWIWSDIKAPKPILFASYDRPYTKLLTQNLLRVPVLLLSAKVLIYAFARFKFFFPIKQYWKHLLITLAPTNSDIAREQTKLLEILDMTFWKWTRPYENEKWNTTSLRTHDSFFILLFHFWKF